MGAIGGGRPSVTSTCERAYRNPEAVRTGVSAIVQPASRAAATQASYEPRAHMRREGDDPRVAAPPMDQRLANPSSPPAASTTMVSPLAKSPDRMRLASGFSSCCWIARLSGRAP